jgi:hypothetical protein
VPADPAVGSLEGARLRPSHRRWRGGPRLSSRRANAYFSIDPGPSEVPASTVGGMTMAQVDHWEDGDGDLDLDPFYNVTMAVGPVGTAPNRRDDVLLVQYLLTNIVGTVVVGPDGSSWVPPNVVGPGWDVWVPPKTAKSIQVNGRMDPGTAAWIKSYQNSLSLKLKDGRIDRALGSLTSNTLSRYTILYLNHHFQNAQPKKFEALEDDSEAPDKLRIAISLSRKHGAKGLPMISPGLID